nr:hypothetical protein [Inquilinus limosus]
MPLVAPVDMGVDLQDPDRPVAGKARQEGDDDRIVAAQQHRHGARRQHLARLLLDPGPVPGVVAHRGRDGADIDAAGRPAVEQRAAEIEVPMRDKVGIVLAGGADGVGRQGVAAAVRAGIGGAMPGPEDHDPGAAVAGEAGGETQEAGRGGHGAPVTRQITSPTSSAISSDLPSGPTVTPTGRP